MEQQRLEAEERQRTHLLADAFLSGDDIRDMLDEGELSTLRESLNLPAVSALRGQVRKHREHVSALW